MSDAQDSAETSEIIDPGRIEEHVETVQVLESSEHTLQPSNDGEPAPEAVSEVVIPSATPASNRPRRNARKSVLYNNADYELQMPIKEEDLGYDRNQMTSAEAVTKVPKRGRASDGVPRGSKKRKQAPHLEENIPVHRENVVEERIFADDSDLHVGAETEIPHEDDGPPVLNISSSYAHQSLLGPEDPDDMSYADEDDDYLDHRPPDLEVNLPSKRRGRPKKRGERGGALDASGQPIDLDETIEGEKKEKKRPKSMRFGERVVSKTLADRQYHVKLFEDEVEMTENGDCYATVISGCLAYLLRKERIIELLTNETEIAMIRAGGWLLDKPPRLPPLVQHKACFAFYVDGSKMTSIKELSNDDLKPWSSSGDRFGEPVIKPNVRRHPVSRVSGRLQPVKGDLSQADLHLTEYSAWLPRLLRLRKKIFYLSRDGQIYGNVIILYDYTCAGEAPIVVNLPHGNDYLRSAMMDNQSVSIMGNDPDEPASTPFEDELVDGPRGGSFLRVKPNKLGWAHNKKLLLRYLINEPALLEESNCLNRRVPFMPPLISTVGVFVYFVPSNFVANQIHHSGDGLSPWTVNPMGDSPSPRVRSTKRAMIQDDDGMFIMSKDTGGWTQTPLSLVETMSVLARCPRLRKRVIYIQRNNTIIIGNVCYIYEYVRDGPIPTPMPKTLSGSRGFIPKLHMDAWQEQKKVLPDPNVAGTSQDVGPSTSVDNTADEDAFIDVEDLEVVEEEVIGDVNIHDMHHQGVQMHQMEPMQPMIMEDEMIEMSTEDVLNNGYDVEFDDDPLSQQENPAPYYENPRQLDTGHIYLTVRHKRIASTFEAVLEWIANTNAVEERGLINYAKPGHPPIVRNARAYAFFVAGTAIFPHDINRDDFSPWSHNGNAQNPTCYRTKVRKLGVICDEVGNQFQIKDVDYKTCPFHLVFLYSINPREPRLRKKIYYLMETESRLVVSHALIMYDYNQEGELPRMHGGYLKRFSKRSSKRAPLQIHDIENDVSDISESEKECPFIVPPSIADDGSMYLQLIDLDFWNDRNRQLHFLVNKPSLVEALGCLNSRVPALPPATNNKGAYVFFVDGLEVDVRNLTCDALVPWSENNSTAPHGSTTKRPKSNKTVLALNRDNQLRVWKTPAHSNTAEFQLHTYVATLPRCPRLRKKVTYVLKNGHQIGHAMIIYWYTEPGEIPQPININVLSQDYSLQRLPPAVREDVHRLLSRMTPAEVSKEILEKHGINVSQKMLYYVRRREIMSMTSDQLHQDSYDMKNNELIDPSAYVEDWTHGPSEGVIKKHQLMDVGEIPVSQEEIANQAYLEGRKMHEHPVPQEPRSFIKSSLGSTGTIRGAQRNDALWRIAKSSFGALTDNETFDMLFKMLYERNENRLLHMVNTTFGVEIMPGEEILDNGMLHLEEVVEEIVEEEVVQEEEGGNDDKVYINEKVISGMEQVIVEEEVHDHLLEHQLVEGVIVEEQEVDPSTVVIDHLDPSAL